MSTLQTNTRGTAANLSGHSAQPQTIFSQNIVKIKRRIIIIVEVFDTSMTYCFCGVLLAHWQHTFSKVCAGQCADKVSATASTTSTLQYPPLSLNLLHMLANAWIAGYSTSKTYLETLADLPWNRFASRQPDQRPQQPLPNDQQAKDSTSDSSGSDATVDSATSQADSSAAQRGSTADQQTEEPASTAHPGGHAPGRLQHPPPGAHETARLAIPLFPYSRQFCEASPHALIFCS